MPQVLKPDRRARLIAAAESTFAERGYQAASIAAIAERAQASTGNVYRYFANKEELFAAVVDQAFAAAFMDILKRRVQDLAKSPDLTTLGHGARKSQSELLDFWITHRLKVIILLDRAEGSPFENFGERFVSELMRATLRHVHPSRNEHKTKRAIEQVLLGTIFDNTRRAIVSILESSADESELRRTFEGFWSYQLAGLSGFNKWVSS